MYTPNTEQDQRAMLDRIGLDSVDQLFDSIPDDIRLRRPLDLPPSLTEIELTSHMTELGKANESASDKTCFLGAGCYDHFVPAVVDTVASRSEYYTAYTPYQAEASQGTLQVGFEFQTLMCQLTGMAVANASLYEGATSVVEAVFVALAGSRNRSKVVISETVHPEYRRTLATYVANLDVEIVTVPALNGSTNVEEMKDQLDDTTACLVVQSPNVFGIVEPIEKFCQAAHDAGAVAIQSFDPISLGMLKRPGDAGVDIAIAEGQGLGTPMSYGGPYLGIFTCQEPFLRRIPGRVVGETVDREGKRAFVLTLQTREQHIRREKATSNICTNQGLLALRAATHLSLLGPQGLREVAESCFQKAHYAAKCLTEVPGIELAYPGPFFKEFVLQLPDTADSYLERMDAEGFWAGVPLGQFDAKWTNHLLVAVTEKRTKQEIDEFAAAWRRVLS
ncbi:putative glycine dehydrogenase (decarboxylating) subunit 1 [Planctomycetes bacterium Pan216]|uniref:Probable glycine dehydrogenase (decarboxylating) subunit 1 n=1 Tax=Kolteria novifilia TaxID=2527975 RepID=A0A518B764_9BACT|nr:putative glycine dehydrogenase (decarboxylating) subunit 1 [Planctomycetes bacterium Pan216]